MATVIEITLSDKAEKYLNELLYSLDFEGQVNVTPSIAISHALEEAAMFEHLNNGETITGWAYDIHEAKAVRFNQGYLCPLVPKLNLTKR